MMKLIQPPNDCLRGPLMPIGGAEDRKGEMRVLRHFAMLSGGSLARIAIIPTPSALPDTGDYYTEIFNEVGVQETRIINPQSRHQANDPDFVAQLDGVTGVFISGGDQMKLMAICGGTRMVDALQNHSQNGVIVGGTSAGASALSYHMIMFGRNGARPSLRMVSLGVGLGLANNLIIDQHFSQRDRLGRLITAVTICPKMLGVGIDEDTSLVIHHDDTAEVVGSGTVTIVDPSGLEYMDMHRAKRYGAFTVIGIQTTTLHHGDRFDLRQRVQLPVEMAFASD